MTMILNFDESPALTAKSTPKKADDSSTGEGTESGKLQVPELALTDLLQRSKTSQSVGQVSEPKKFSSGQSETVCESEMKLVSVVHDHCYSEKTEATAAECSNSSSMDESLQNLFDNCNLDLEFLAEAKPTFQKFLDDVMDCSDVPADDMFRYLDDTGCLVPTKSSSCLSCSPGVPPCLFTSAGSTETKLSTCLALHQPPSSPFQPTSSPSSPASTALTSCITSSSAAPRQLADVTSPFLPQACQFDATCPDLPALDKKLLELLTLLCPDNVCEPSPLSTDSSEGEVKSATSEVDDSVCVSSSHPIVNGRCTRCSLQGSLPTKDDDRTLSIHNNSICTATTSTTTSTTPCNEPSSGHHPSTTGPTRQRCGKRKSVESDSTCDSCVVKRVKADSSALATRLMSAASPQGDAENHHVSVAASQSSMADERVSTKHRMLDCFSFVKGDKAFKFHPLSPININQFGRCG